MRHLETVGDDATGHGPNCGHFRPKERPDEVTTAIRGHLVLTDGHAERAGDRSVCGAGGQGTAA